AIDITAKVNPLCFAVVACFTIMPFAGEHGDGIDGIPERVSANAEATVVVFRQFERLFARAGLRAREINDVRERAIERLLRNLHLPGLIQRLFTRRVAVIEKDVLADEPTDISTTPGFVEFDEADLGGQRAV